MLAGAAAPSGDAATALARLAHRATAFAVLLLAIWLVMLTWARRPSPDFRSAALLLACTLALSLLGVFTPGAVRPVVAMGNLLGGFVLLALCVRLAAPPLPDLRIRPRGPPGRRAAAVAGGRRRDGERLRRRAGLPGLGRLPARRRGRRLGLGVRWTPLRRPELLDAPPFNPAGALVQLVHRSLALPTLLGVLWLAYACRRGGQSGEALAVVVLLGVQLLLAVSLHPAGLPMALVLAHNAAAAALLALALRRV
jgi:cytochrome c oxidase assembly protein subunit 15